jgi:hypothetical protein|tara:strand:- start:43 stop:480 length:438 start_codon:yes stop_codon:yes gene_type:complete
MFSDQTKIGLVCISISFVLLFLGFLIFDSALLTLGNVLFIFGFGCLSGWSRTIQFFSGRLRMSLVFGTSMAIILLTRHTFIGMLLELFSFVMLFHNFLPMLLSWARNMPYIGPLTNLPGVKQCLDRLADLKVNEVSEKMSTGSWA